MGAYWFRGLERENSRIPNLVGCHSLPTEGDVGIFTKYQYRMYLPLHGGLIVNPCLRRNSILSIVNHKYQKLHMELLEHPRKLTTSRTGLGPLSIRSCPSGSIRVTTTSTLKAVNNCWGFAGTLSRSSLAR
jgi:hypothetical protein